MRWAIGLQKVLFSVRLALDVLIPGPDALQDVNIQHNSQYRRNPATLSGISATRESEAGEAYSPTVTKANNTL
jgi:hypothetical protein